jgi:hypothetical protein
MDDIKMPEKSEHPEKSKDLIFEADEFIEYKKNAGWYVIVILLGLLIGGFFVWYRQYSGAVVVVVGTIVLVTQAKSKPKKNQYSINSEGITINQKKHPFNEMKSFWTSISTEGNNIYFKTTKRFSIPITIHLGTADPKPIIDYIKKYVPEDEKMGETTSDKISRLFKF